MVTKITLSMVTKIMEWVSITALLLVVSWRPIASYQIPLDVVVCAGSVMGVLALFFIKREIETHYDVDDGSNPGSRRVTVKTARVAVLSVTVNAGETLMPDTINTGTRLIEEGALLPESVRSETEPWTSFYMAGEIIRELRKAHENKQVRVPATKDDMRKAA
jgi:hypothetical protein